MALNAIYFIVVREKATGETDIVSTCPSECCDHDEDGYLAFGSTEEAREFLREHSGDEEDFDIEIVEVPFVPHGGDILPAEIFNRTQMLSRH
jgi:hypothetical protein